LGLDLPGVRHVWAGITRYPAYAGMLATVVLVMLYPVMNPAVELAVGIKGQHDVFSGDITTVAQARDFNLPDGSRVHLDPYGAVAYDARTSGHRMQVWLIGSARIVVPKGQETVTVIRSNGTVSLAANGTYALRALDGDPMLHLAVLKGEATLKGFSAGAKMLTLMAGETAVMGTEPRFMGYVQDPSKGASSDVRHNAITAGVDG
jgi:ferric-dicitrate binding protein FerR (iron transport regulator)